MREQDSKTDAKLDELASIWRTLPDHAKETILTIARSTKRSLWTMTTGSESLSTWSGSRSR